MEVNMTEFKWKNNFIGQKIEIQHINKFEILLLMLKTKYKNTEKLEESTYSLDVQEISVYEDFLVKHVLPKSEEIKEQSKLLHNQPLFNELIPQIKPNAPLKISLKNKRKVFDRFSRYVNLKDLHKENISFYVYIFSLLSSFIFLVTSFISINWNPFFLISFLLFLFSFFLNRAFKGKSKLFFLNVYRINQELCLMELEKEFRELEGKLNVHCDPYKNFTEEEIFEMFFEFFDVPKDFFDICANNNIIDESNNVNSKFNHILIQYLKLKRKEKFRKENFDWLFLEHIITFDISKNKKSKLLKNGFKKDVKTNEYYNSEGKKFQKFINLIEKKAR